MRAGRVETLVTILHSLPLPGPFITSQFLGIVTRVILEAL